MGPGQVEGAGDGSAASGGRDRLRREQRSGPPRTHDMNGYWSVVGQVRQFCQERLGVGPR